MLKLVNIKMNDAIISADYIPETSELKGYVALNYITSERTFEEVSDYGPEYIRMAFQGLKKIIDRLNSGEYSELPKTMPMIWY